ncbi:MAG: hypothetical protein KDJ14_05040 [Xanthomonadales bacterium]|nr:hypothetical protein [Xanthomonadales bacterium]
MHDWEDDLNEAFVDEVAALLRELQAAQEAAVVRNALRKFQITCRALGLRPLTEEIDCVLREANHGPGFGPLLTREVHALSAALICKAREIAAREGLRFEGTPVVLDRLRQQSKRTPWWRVWPQD